MPAVPRPRPLYFALLAVPLLVGQLGAAALWSPATPAASPAVSATPPAMAILARASERLAATDTVHFALTIEGETYIDPLRTIRLLHAEGDLVRPDRVQTTFQVEIASVILTIQLITIGDQSWSTNLLGRWGPAPDEFDYSPGILFDTQNGIGPVMGRVTNAEQLPDEEIHDRPAHHVRGLVDQAVIGPLTGNTMTGSPVAVELWIDRETDDLLRIKLVEPAAPGRDNPATWTLDLSNHGDEVIIEAPV